SVDLQAAFFSSLLTRDRRVVRFLLFLLIDPAFDVPLFPRADREGVRRHVFTNRRAAADVGTGADCHRCDELGMAADERAVVADQRFSDHAMIEDRHAIADLRADDADAAVDFAPAPNPGPSLD